MMKTETILKWACKQAMANVINCEDCPLFERTCKGWASDEDFCPSTEDCGEMLFKFLQQEEKA